MRSVCLAKAYAKPPTTSPMMIDAPDSVIHHTW